MREQSARAWALHDNQLPKMVVITTLLAAAALVGGLSLTALSWADPAPIAPAEGTWAARPATNAAALYRFVVKDRGGREVGVATWGRSPRQRGRRDRVARGELSFLLTLYESVEGRSEVRDAEVLRSNLWTLCEARQTLAGPHGHASAGVVRSFSGRLSGSASVGHDAEWSGDVSGDGLVLAQLIALLQSGAIDPAGESHELCWPRRVPASEPEPGGPPPLMQWRASRGVKLRRDGEVTHTGFVEGESLIAEEWILEVEGLGTEVLWIEAGGERRFLGWRRVDGRRWWPRDRA